MMARPTTFVSALTPILDRYVDLKQSLGRRFASQVYMLRSLDRFLRDGNYLDLDATAFQGWCRTHEHVASGVRRGRMFAVYNFCLYRRRSEHGCFVPDPKDFPARHQTIIPYIFSATDVTRLLKAAVGLARPTVSPLRPEVTRLAIVLLFTTGIRRGELVKLVLRDYNRQDATLLIRETKFFKSRLLPVNRSIAQELDRYLQARSRRGLSASRETPLMWNAGQGGRPYTGGGLKYTLRQLFRQCEVVTARGCLPRIHDFRHSFAVNALLRWYRLGVDVGTKLPLLATYLGHGQAASTHYYLQFIEPLRTAMSNQFAEHYGALVAPEPPPNRRSR